MLSYLGLILAVHNTLSESQTESFKWGTATAAYQIEGAIDADGKLPSIWDVFVKQPNTIYKNQTGDRTDESYYRFKEDIAIMKALDLKSYRVSISWPRIIPDGRNINQKGIDYYKELINALLDAGIEPFLTLYHWDLPQAIYNKTNGGWTNESIVDYYMLFARTVFTEFNGLIDNWLTFNEPLTFCYWGYGIGIHAPGHFNEHLSCVHNVLIAHAKAYKYFKSSNIKGEIGITLNCNFGVPASDSEADYNATQRFITWQLGLFADPIWFGDYPQVMKDVLGPAMPSFTDQQKEDLKGSHDFFGLNHYSTFFVKYDAKLPSYTGQFNTSGVNQYNNTAIGERGESDWLYVVPWGIYENIKWVDERYGNPKIYITENGCDVPNEDDMGFDEVINDEFRIDYLSGYITEITRAKHTGSNVMGYFVWSLMDNFEWAVGYRKRFGIHFVNFTSQNLTRYPKKSATWYAQYVRENPNADYIAGSGGDKDKGDFAVIMVVIAIAIVVVTLLVFIGLKVVRGNKAEKEESLNYGLLGDSKDDVNT
eukprot:418470_1